MAVLVDGTPFYRLVGGLPARTARTWMGWAYATSLPAASGFFCIGAADAAVGIGIHNLAGTTRWGIGTNLNNFDSTVIVSTNTWYHVAIVQSSNSKTLYVDGVQDGSGSDAETNITDLMVAALVDAGGGTWVGRLAAIKVFNIAMTIAEIQQERWFYKAVTNAPYSLYPFLSITSDQDDFSGNGRTLTVTGTPTTDLGPPIAWRAQTRRRWYFLAPGATTAPIFRGV